MCASAGLFRTLCPIRLASLLRCTGHSRQHALRMMMMVAVVLERKRHLLQPTVALACCQRRLSDSNIRLLADPMGDDLILDLVVGGLGDDPALHKLVLGRIRPPVDYFFGVRIANAGERL